VIDVRHFITGQGANRGGARNETIGGWQMARSIRQRRLLMALIDGALMAAVAAIFLCFGFPVRRPDLLLIRNVKLGMTESDVVAIFGTQPTTIPPDWLPSMTGPATVKYWYCDAGVVWVAFGMNGRATYSGQYMYRSSGDSAFTANLRRILRWVGLA
jgi:hypothetical protein